MYTTQGYMTPDDYQEYLKDTDQGSTEIRLDDPPTWFVVPATCPVCPDPMIEHGSVTVQDTSGEIIACDY